jgi:hypothetical protein
MHLKTYKTCAPDDSCIENGAKFWSLIDRYSNGHSGQIEDAPESVRWRFGARRNPDGHTFRNPFGKKDFVVSEETGPREVIVRRTSFFLPEFQMIEGGHPVGRIRLVTPLRNKYAIDIGDRSWTFRMPLYTVHFFAESQGEGAAWVIPKSNKAWGVLLRPGLSAWPLIAAIAFIQVERWNYG